MIVWINYMLNFSKHVLVLTTRGNVTMGATRVIALRQKKNFRSHLIKTRSCKLKYFLTKKRVQKIMCLWMLQNVATQLIGTYIFYFIINII